MQRARVHAPVRSRARAGTHVGAFSCSEPVRNLSLGPSANRSQPASTFRTRGQAKNTPHAARSAPPSGSYALYWYTATEHEQFQPDACVRTRGHTKEKHTGTILRASNAIKRKLSELTQLHPRANERKTHRRDSAHCTSTVTEREKFQADTCACARGLTSARCTGTATGRVKFQTDTSAREGTQKRETRARFRAPRRHRAPSRRVVAREGTQKRKTRARSRTPRRQRVILPSDPGIPRADE